MKLKDLVTDRRLGEETTVFSVSTNIQEQTQRITASLLDEDENTQEVSEKMSLNDTNESIAQFLRKIADRIDSEDWDEIF